MPVHRIPGSTLDDMESGVASIEAAGESIVQITPYAGCWVIVTEAKPSRPKPAAKKTITRQAPK